MPIAKRDAKHHLWVEFHIAKDATGLLLLFVYLDCPVGICLACHGILEKWNPERPNESTEDDQRRLQGFASSSRNPSLTGQSCCGGSR
ncbi:hypothetical protein [Roseiconus lacunae]|uniref:hypothetical protein n=1 Tax=Roseiconus lacunae TaxID=2605694 RepID=UPI001E5A9C88|nr:hypothetical protein [Roseiconus lacunae]MCD0459546.1 hypothetical protein [Roseiconus lacunae]